MYKSQLKEMDTYDTHGSYLLELMFNNNLYFVYTVKCHFLVQQANTKNTKTSNALSTLPIPNKPIRFPKCNNRIHEWLQECAQEIGRAITEVLSFPRHTKPNLI